MIESGDIASFAIGYGLNFNCLYIYSLEKRKSEEYFILLRKTSKIPENTKIIDVNSNEFNWLQKVQAVLARNEAQSINNTRIIFVEEGNFQSGLLVFINCLRKEPGGDIFRAVLIQDLKAPKFSLNLPLYSEQLETDLVTNVLRPGNVWGSYRHQLLRPCEPRLTYHTIINQLIRGDLSTIRWIEGPITKDYQNENLISIHYASLNFKDVMLSMSKIVSKVCSRKDRDCLIRSEYSGKSITGRRIMGLNHNKYTSYSNHIRTFSWTVPNRSTLEDAATAPCVYCTCIAALYINGDMQKGCEVFTTVDTPEKRKFIKETFPSIDDNHIGNSRDTSFEKMILQGTNGAGVDIVLNSLAEDKFQTSLRCLTNKGRFLEIGKFDLAANNQLSSKIFMKGISFHGVMLDQIMNTNDEVKNEISSIFNKLMKENAIKPIIRTVFGQDEVETALRFMAAGKHMGKVLIKILEENEPLNTPILSEPFYTCIPNKSYIVLGGLGGFGLELIDWLILRNAQNIILVGVDAANRDSSELIVKSAIDQGPVDGIFNLAASLKDSICRNQTPETFEESFKGKAWATKCLDEVTRKLCPDLRHFVVFSSVSCGRGNAGQTNYGMANSIMERICEKRVEEGFPGLDIQWGAIGDVGLVAEMQNEDKEFVIGGTLLQRISSCLQVLNGFLVQDKTVVGSMIIADKRNNSNMNNVVDAVLNILCIKDLNNINPRSFLPKLRMDSMPAVEIKQTLEREYEIYLTATDIRNLNLVKLVDMNNNLTENTISLKTSSVEVRDEIFFLPGIEGYANAFKTLESKIKSPATCFQFETNYELKSIEAITNFILLHILDKLEGRSEFILVGYSFGLLIGIELKSD
uniref:Uncharacterized protein n=2 Tax=Vespula pensylvanica TaxID=30213 RepID=A0A834UCX6_VESPE|nr:hypothetical protein H0235_004462 [Vespula pensylvanica]